MIHLSEYGLIIHGDCDSGMLPPRDRLLDHHLTKRRAVRDFILAKVQQPVTEFMHNTRNLTCSRQSGTVSRGNAGVSMTVSFLFDPLVNFHTVAEATQAVIASLTTFTI